MTPYSPEQFENLMTAYVLGDLDPTETEAFVQMLEEYPELKAEVAKRQAAFALLPYALPEVAPPPHVRSQILAAAQETRSPDRSRRRFSWSWSETLASAAVLVAVILGVDTYYTHQALNRSQSLANRQAEILAVLQDPQARWVALKGANTASSGQVIFDHEQKKLVLALKKLDSLSSSQIYRLWAVVDHQKIACSDFHAQESGIVLDSRIIPNAACTVPQATLVVTKEPYPSPPQPVGSAVLISQ
jgi:anti-sigma-K factor RskA